MVETDRQTVSRWWASVGSGWWHPVGGLRGGTLGGDAKRGRRHGSRSGTCSGGLCVERAAGQARHGAGTKRYVPPIVRWGSCVCCVSGCQLASKQTGQLATSSKAGSWQLAIDRGKTANGRQWYLSLECADSVACRYRAVRTLFEAIVAGGASGKEKCRRQAGLWKASRADGRTREEKGSKEGLSLSCSKDGGEGRRQGQGQEAEKKEPAGFHQAQRQKRYHSTPSARCSVGANQGRRSREPGLNAEKSDQPVRVRLSMSLSMRA